MNLKEKSYKIFLFSDHYKQMVINTLEMAIERENSSVIVSDICATDQAINDKMKYCDYSIIYPLLFLFRVNPYFSVKLRYHQFLPGLDSFFYLFNLS